MPEALSFDLIRLARFANTMLLVLPMLFFAAGHYISFYFHVLTVVIFLRRKQSQSLRRTFARSDAKGIAVLRFDFTSLGHSEGKFAKRDARFNR